MNDTPQNGLAGPAAEIDTFVRARTPIVWVTAPDEARAIRTIAEVAALRGRGLRLWACTTGLTDLDGANPDAEAGDPLTALGRVASTAKPTVFVFRDLHGWLRNDRVLLRAIRDLARTLPNAPREAARTVVILTPGGEIPTDIAVDVVAYDWPLPTGAEIAGLARDLVAAGAANATDTDALADAARGLTLTNAEEVLARARARSKGAPVAPAAVAAEKKRIIAATGTLEYVDPDPRGLDAVGGLDALKAWLVERGLALSREARTYGLPLPRGAVLVGVPGGGKSLTAKAVGAAWKLPTIRYDVGATFGKYVGDTEASTRRTLATVDAVAPCVLWIDEVEKSLAGSSGGASDGGTGTRLLGSILTWLQDRAAKPDAAPVFVVVTANDVSALPPEFLRKGRFDEVFFVDLPNAAERAEIVGVIARKFKRDPAKFGAPAIAAETDGFTGAEIEAAFEAALFRAFADGAREPTTDDVIVATRETAPLSRTAGEKITALREWAKGRARFASAKSDTVAVGTSRFEGVE